MRSIAIGAYIIGVGLALHGAAAADLPAVDIGSRRELFVDRLLIDTLDGAELRMGEPREAGVALKFDKPWEGLYTLYVTVFRDGDIYRMYYRGAPVLPTAGADVYTCYAESKNGITWTRPNLGLYEVFGTRENNVVLTHDIATHNFAPFLDTRPGVPPEEKYKALGGLGGKEGGPRAWCSADGIHWKKMRDEPVLTKGAFDSQNVAFWSEAEGCYIAYYRIFTGGGTDEKTWKPKGVRWVARSTSKDFINWGPMIPMKSDQPLFDHIYVNQTQPYFRAPHLYVAPAARFMQGRSVISDQAKKYLGITDGKTLKQLGDDCSDTVLMTSRAGSNVYNRTFMESFVRPGPHFRNWTTRSNYAACGVVQTGHSEMSLYIDRHYGQPVNLLQRYTLRLDGFASLHAPYTGGTMTTKPLTFTGKALHLNLSTSSAGHVAVEIQDAATGQPIPGFALADCKPITYDIVDRLVQWTGGSDVSKLAGKPIRLRFELKDADVYSFWFGSDKVEPSESFK